MRTNTSSVLVSLGLLFATSAALASGSIQVSYAQPEKFADIGWTPHDREDNLKILSKHFEALAGRYLGDGQKLTIEVLDVDLAGEKRPSRRMGQDVRVLKGAADFPRITLRYTLESAGQAARSGEQKLSDMAYLQRISDYRNGEALAHEKRMLDKWFVAQFGPANAK